MNIPIQPIKALVHERFLYDGDESKTGYASAEIIGISSYLGQALTFHALIDGQYLYSDLPVSAFTAKKTKPRELKDLCYSNCESLPIDAFRLPFDKAMVYFKERKEWESGTYLLSIDFYEGNDLSHLVRLDTGELCLMPNHKISCGGEKQLADYKKCRTTFRI